ncbi:MAG TPA: isocitrate lyase/phosphoenolpyruvate mutase family protein [Rhodanobacteraceae bacterium]|nr:isocitrate lyase/phosphoenolpyruvate mutase family protein [Rhodanobacteraceae bacterium]
MNNQLEKAERFRALHARRDAFILPNPWDRGSARLLAQAGFEALATTSAGYAFSLGLRDNAVGRERMLAHVAELASATELPLSVDLENGFGHDPETVAETIRLTASAGAVGGSIEDATGDPAHPLYDLDRAVMRIRAAAEAARALPFPFTLTARAENFLVGKPDLDDVIARLRAYQEAGADVLYAPGLQSHEQIDAVLRALDRPLNVLASAAFDRATLAHMGVRRISVGGALTRAAYGALLRAAREMRERGTFEFAKDAVSHRDIEAMLG